MFRSLIFLSLALSFAQVSQCLSYWIDPDSCKTFKDHNNKNVEKSKMMVEAISMGKRSLATLTSDTDTDYALVFDTMFKVSKTDSKAFNKVKGMSNPTYARTASWTGQRLIISSGRGGS